MERLKKIILAPFKILVFVLQKTCEGVLWFFSQTFIQNLLKISVLLFIVLVVGPVLYFYLGLPPQLHPDNYFEFLNAGLLLYLTYQCVLKRSSHNDEDWFIKNEDSHY
jgi:hypothetical protein